jgi:DNA-binding NarL/FixJ family response regulator
VTESPRVLVADDQALVRTGFRMILAADGITVVGEATTGAEAVAEVRRTRPDVVLMDIRMPEMDGLAATRRILTGAPGEPCVIILTTFDLDRYVYAALSAGASEFLLKDVTPEHLVAAVRTVRAGDALLAPVITRRLVERYALRDTGAERLHRGPVGADPPRAGSPAAARGRAEQRRTRRSAAPGGGDGEDARRADPRETGPAGPGASRRAGLRNRTGEAGRELVLHNPSPNTVSAAPRSARSPTSPERYWPRDRAINAARTAAPDRIPCSA